MQNQTKEQGIQELTGDESHLKFRKNEAAHWGIKIKDTTARYHEKHYVQETKLERSTISANVQETEDQNGSKKKKVAHFQEMGDMLCCL